MSSSFATSTCTYVACPPEARISSCTACPVVSVRPVTTTAAPSAANLVAIARPIPRVEPVTSATFCERRLLIRSEPATLGPGRHVHMHGRARAHSYTCRDADRFLAQRRALVVRDPARDAASTPRRVARAGLG